MAFFGINNNCKTQNDLHKLYRQHSPLGVKAFNFYESNDVITLCKNKKH